MTHGDAGEGNADIRPRAVERERRTTCVVAIGLEGDLVGQADDVVEQSEQLLRLLAVIEAGDDLERLGDLLEVGLQLGLQIGVQHDGIPLANSKFRTNKRPDGSRPGVRAP